MINCRKIVTYKKITSINVIFYSFWTSLVTTFVLWSRNWNHYATSIWIYDIIIIIVVIISNVISLIMWQLFNHNKIILPKALNPVWSEWRHAKDIINSPAKACLFEGFDGQIGRWLDGTDSLLPLVQRQSQTGMYVQTVAQTYLSETVWARYQWSRTRDFQHFECSHYESVHRNGRSGGHR